jgi:hypothetical protein
MYRKVEIIPIFLGLLKSYPYSIIHLLFSREADKNIAESRYFRRIHTGNVLERPGSY